MSNRDVLLYLSDILESIDAINSYIVDIDFDTFHQDRKTYSATIREFIIIGEGIANTIITLKENNPHYPWRTLKDFRNLIVHEYFGVDPKIVYDAANIFRTIDHVPPITSPLTKDNGLVLLCDPLG